MRKGNDCSVAWRVARAWFAAADRASRLPFGWRPRRLWTRARIASRPVPLPKSRTSPVWQTNPRSARVVAVGGGDSEQRQDLVADELVHDSTVLFHDGDRVGLEACHHGLDGLGIQALVQGRVAGEVREDDRGLTPLALDLYLLVRLPNRGRFLVSARQCEATFAAEAKGDRDGSTTTRTGAP